MLLPLLPCYSLDYLGWQLLDQPFLFYIFSSFHPSLPCFPHGVYCGFLRFLASLPPSPILLSSFLLPVILVPVPISATVLASVPVPVPVPIRCSSRGLLCVYVVLLTLLFTDQASTIHTRYNLNVLAFSPLTRGCSEGLGAFNFFKEHENKNKAK